MVLGWPPSLRVLIPIARLIQESRKVTFESPMIVLSSHHLSELLTYKGLQTFPQSWILLIQVALIDNPMLTFQTCSPINLSTLLPFPSPDTNSPSSSHSCQETLEDLLSHPFHIHEGTLSKASIFMRDPLKGIHIHEGPLSKASIFHSKTEARLCIKLFIVDMPSLLVIL